MAQDGKLLRETISFSRKILKLYEKLDRLSALKTQMLRSGTSIGANVHEAEYAESGADFVHKMKIALKECHETEYWLLILTEEFPNLEQDIQSLKIAAGRIRSMLIAVIRKMSIE